jgi:hypothetical protein
MMLQMMCIYSGIPLWISPSIESSKETNTLVGGFLSALNTFARATVGNTISNMTIGENLWSFKNLHNIDDFFIVSQLELTGQQDEKKYRKRIMSDFISEIIDRFIREFPPSTFENYQPNSSDFEAFQKYVQTKIIENINILNRYQKRDINWFTQLDKADSLITALICKKPIFIISDNIDELPSSEKFLIFHATIESILESSVKEIYRFNPEFLHNIEENYGGKIILANHFHLKMLNPLDIAIFDFSEMKLIKGPSALPIAQNIVNYLRKNKQKDFDHQKLISNPENISGISFDKFIQQEDTVATEFVCKLCEKPIKFHINDESTYISKNEHQNFFGMELTTYKILHFQDQEVHVNSVLVDKKGIFHGIIEDYKINPTQKELGVQTFRDKLVLLSDHQEHLKTHIFIDSLYILNPKFMWLMEIICPTGIRSLEIGNLILKKFDELKLIYDQIPEFHMLNIADKTFYIEYKDPYLIIVNLKKPDYVEFMKEFSKLLLSQNLNENEFLIKRERLNLALKFMEQVKVTKSDIPIIKKIIFEDLLSLQIKIKYPEQIPRIINRLSKEFPIAVSVLNAILYNNTPIIELLKKEYLSRTRELINLVEFINRRNIVI